jgi:hypothetical protein
MWTAPRLPWFTAMRCLTVSLLLGSLAIAGCGPRAPWAAEPAPSEVGLGALPTSPAGVGPRAGTGLAELAVHRAREFRGNPIPLAVLTGGVLVVALGLGLYTVRVAYRRPTDDGAS